MTHRRVRPPRACPSGKIRYPDHQSAVRTMHTIANFSQRDRKASRVYECPECRGWHLTARVGW